MVGPARPPRKEPPRVGGPRTDCGHGGSARTGGASPLRWGPRRGPGRSTGAAGGLLLGLLPASSRPLRGPSLGALSAECL
eukprot:5895600-Alexandrium_andersonii.AAC.1